MTETNDQTPMTTTKKELTQELEALRRQVDELKDQVRQQEQTNQALSQERFLFEALLNSNPDPIYFKDAAGRFIKVNQTMAHSLGLHDPAQAEGQTDLALVPEEQAQLIREGDQTVLQTGQPVIKEITGMWPDHPEKSVLAITLPLRDESDHIFGTLGITSDLTRRRLAESEYERIFTALERRNAQLTTAVEVAHAASSILDPDVLISQVVNLVRDRFNLYYAGLFLVDESGEWAVLRAGTGEAGQRMVDQGHRLEIGDTSMIGWCIAHQQARIALDVGEEAVRFENPLLPETRSELALPLISRGQAIGALTIQSSQEAAFSEEDITTLQAMADQLANAITNAHLYEQAQREISERQWTETSLYKSEEKYHTLLEYIKEGYYEVDLSGNFTSINNAMCDIFGYNTDEMKSMNYRQLMSDDAAQEVYRHFNQVYRTGNPTQVLGWEITRKDGAMRYIEASILLMEDTAGEPIGFRGVLRDVTKYRQAQDQYEELLDALEHRNTQLQTAAEVSRAVSSILNPEALAPQVVDLVRERFGLYYAGLFLVDQTGEWTNEPYKWAVLQAGTGEAGRQMLKQGHKLEIGGASMIGWCIANKQARISLDVGEDAVRFDNPLLPETRSELALPLINRGRPIGALTIQSSQESAFTRDDITVLQTMADQMANAIANARLYNQAQREINERKRAEETMRQVNQNLGVLSRLGQELSATLDLQQIIDHLLPEATEITGAEGALIWLVDDKDEKEELFCQTGFQLELPSEMFDVRLPSDQGIVGWVVQTGESTLISSAKDDLRFTIETELPPHLQTVPLLAVPLRAHDQVIGVVEMMAQPDQDFDLDDLILAETIAASAAIAIANARLFDQAQREINERWRAEKALQENEQRLRTIMDSLQIGITIIDAETHRIVDVNPAAVEMLGAPREEIIEHTCYQFLCPMEEGNCPITDSGQTIDKSEQELITISGESIPILKTVTPVTLSGRLHLVESFLDITERKQAAEALQFAHEELAQYTDNLERRTAQLQVGAEVAREAAAILDVQQLLDTVVNLISERFGYYHAGVFLIDEPREYAILRAASSKGGLHMLERGHKLAVGKVGIVGYVAATGEPRIALDVGEDAVHFVNPDLPDTHSEMGLPLKVRGETIGVLDVQSIREAAFSEDDIAVLQTLADQLAVAIDNARLVERTETQLRELSLLYGEYAASTWADLTTEERALSYVYDRIDVAPAERLSIPALDMALTQGETIALTEQASSERLLATPLKLHDQIIGSIGIQETNGGQGWSPDEIALVEAVSEQVALALENAQHFATTQKSAREMQILNDLAQALTTKLNVEDVLQETYRGAARLLDTTNFYIGLYDAEANHITLPIHVTKSEIDSQITVIPADHGITGYVVESREPVLLKDNVIEWQKEHNIPVVGETAGSWLGVPMLIGDQVLGVIAVQSFDKAHAYDEHDRDLLTAIASQTAIALQNARLFEETRQRVQELGTLFEASQHLSSATLQAEDIADIVARQFVQVLGVPEASVSLLDQDDNTMRVVVDVYAKDEHIRSENTQTTFNLSDYPATARVMETLKPMIIQASDPTADPAERSYMEAYQVKTLVIVPLAAKGKSFGVIELESHAEELHLTQGQLNLAITLANQAAVAMDNARLFEETQRRAAQLAAAAEVARDATSILDVDQLLDETVHLISKQFNFYHAGVFLPDERDEYAVLRAASSEGGKRMLAREHKLPIGKVGIVGYVAATGEPRIALDVGQDAMHFVNPDLPNTRSEMGLPLKVRDRVIGVLDVQSTQQSAFSEDDVATLQTLADQLAAAIANARLFQEVRADAKRRALINEVQQAAATSFDPDELLHQAGEVISIRLARPSILMLWQGEKNAFRPVAIHDEQGQDIPLIDKLWIDRESNPTIISKVVGARRTTVLDTATSYTDHIGAMLTEQVGIKSGTYVPLVARDRVLGLLILAEPEGRPSDEMDFAEIIGANLSVALENARLYQDAVETAEQLQEMDRLKSQFLANMSHELRTPLNSIIGFSRVILKGIDGPLTDMQRTDLEAVYNSGQHLLGLINDILDISKIQAGKMEIGIEDTDVNDIVKGVMSTAIALVKEQPIELQQSVPEDIPTIQADSRRIRQVLLNIVGNATKFTDEGFIRVEAQATPTEVILSVSDSGIGIPKEKLETIFDEFTQVDGSSTRAVGGTGLGLAISRQFIEMHGGRIWVESVLNEGTTFYIALPIAGPPEPGAEEEETGEEAVTDEADQPVVLCVDDDAGVITLFRRYLSKQGYHVVGLTDGEVVVEKAREIDPFAITLDVMMPKKDGWQVMQELKADPQTRQIPVIICSIVSDKEQGISLGASEYLVKPIIEDDLVNALERLELEHQELERVLVVDDNLSDRQLLRRMIESQEKYEVIEATGGQEAITLIKMVRPDLIILDLMMPDVDGFAVLESVKADKTTRTIPIVVVTAKDLTSEERESLNKRVESLLQKGLFEQQELLADVAAALERLGATANSHEQ